MNLYELLIMVTVRVENFEGRKFRAIPDFALFRKCCGYSFHVYNFRVISHPQKTRN